MKNQYEKYKDRIIWKTVKNCVNDLERNKDIKLTTNEDYVVGYLTKIICSKFKISKKS